MAIGNWYRVGTVSVTNGSANIIGVGTFWTSQCNPGDRFTVDGENWYELISIVSDTQATIQGVGGSGAFAGATGANLAYAIDRNFTNNLNANIAASVAALVAQYQANSNGPLSGLFQDGAAATPGIGFLNEASTGWFRKGAGIAALAVQGGEFLRAVGASAGVPAMLGIGQAAPANALDVLTTNNALYGARVQNTSPGTAARAGLQLGNGAQVLNLGVNGANYTASGVLSPGRGFVEGPAGVDFASGVTGGDAYTWGVGPGNARKMALDFQGNLTLTGGKMGVGTAPAPWTSANLNSLDVGGWTGLASDSAHGSTYLTNNAYWDGLNWRSKFGTVGSGQLTLSNGLLSINIGAPVAAGTPITFSTALTVDASGNFLIGSSAANATCHVVNKSVAQGTLIQSVSSTAAGANSTLTYAVGSQVGALAACGLFVGVNTSTGRSINACGTVNASGSDYAEYRQLVPALYGAVTPGMLLGYDADGRMTDLFAKVVGRVLPASTSPSYVGGDTWGTQAAIDAAYHLASPAVVAEPGPSATAEETAVYAAYRTALATYQAGFAKALATEESHWGMIALCGVVPVAVSGLAATDAGKYLVPCAAADGTITATAVAKADLTLAQYIDSFGTIEMIGADGRPLVNVKNG